MTQLSHLFSTGDLERMVLSAVQGLADVEHEYQDTEGHWWLVNVRAYRTADDRIDGAVLAVQDIDELKRAVERAQTAQRDAERANTAKDNWVSSHANCARSKRYRQLGGGSQGGQRTWAAH
jgi:two-component system CheB/CheR fusion protein